MLNNNCSSDLYQCTTSVVPISRYFCQPEPVSAGDTAVYLPERLKARISGTLFCYLDCRMSLRPIHENETLCSWPPAEGKVFSLDIPS
jgi:hypothetical protein